MPATASPDCIIGKPAPVHRPGSSRGMDMKTLSMRPYPGNVMVCKTRKEYQSEHKRMHGHKDNGLTSRSCGRFTGRTLKNRGVEYLVWADGHCYLAHELSHVILNSFESVGIDPRDAGGEPFCYMLSQLMIEATQCQK